MPYYLKHLPMALPDRTLLAQGLLGSTPGDARSELLRAYALAFFACTAALVISLLALLGGVYG